MRERRRYLALRLQKLSTRSSTAANLVMYTLAHEKKKYGFTPNLDFNPLFTRFNFTEFLHTSNEACTSREKRTSKHGISIVLKLVSIEYQRRDAFLAAV